MPLSRAALGPRHTFTSFCIGAESDQCPVAHSEDRVVVLPKTPGCRDWRDKGNRGAVMENEVWGGVEDWGLEDHSDDSPVISTDPVCGRQVTEAKAAGKTGYAGVLYYFCSKECQRNFEQAPGDYTGQARGARSQTIDINVAGAQDLRE